MSKSLHSCQVHYALSLMLRKLIEASSLCMYSDFIRTNLALNELSVCIKGLYELNDSDTKEVRWRPDTNEIVMLWNVKSWRTFQHLLAFQLNHKHWDNPDIPLVCVNGVSLRKWTLQRGSMIILYPLNPNTS